MRRRLRIVTSVLAVIALLGVATITVALHNLEHPIVKSRLQATLRSAGIELDYASASASITSGLHMAGITIASAAPVRAIAPQLVRIGALDVTWGLGRLARANIDGVAIRDVDVTVVFDDDGATSFDFAPPTTTQATPPAEPRSKTLDALLSSPLPLRDVAIGPIHVIVMRTRHGAVYDRVELSQLAIEVHREGARTTLNLGHRATPLRMPVTRKAELSLDMIVSLFLEAHMEPGTLGATLELGVDEQELVPGLRRVLALDLAVHPDAKQGKLSITLSHLDLADVVSLGADAELPDDGSALVHTAEGHVDVTRLLALVPKKLVPELPRLKKGELELHANKVVLDPLPRVLEGGELRCTGVLEDVHVERAGMAAIVPRVHIDVRSGADRKIDATVEAHLETLRLDAPKAELRDAKLEVTARGIELDPAHRAGSVVATLHTAQLTTNAGGLRTTLTDLALKAESTITPAPPYAGTAQLDVARVQLSRAGKSLLDDALHAHLVAHGVHPDGKHAVARVELALGAVTLQLDANRANSALAYTLALEMPTLALLGRVVGPDAGVPWSDVGIALTSKGTVALNEKSIRHDTSISLTHPSLHGAAGTIAAQSVALTFASHGGAQRHEGDVGIVFTALARDGVAFGDGRIATHVRFDAEAPSLGLVLHSEGAGAPGLAARADFAFDRRRKRVSFDLDLDAKKLDPVAPLLGKLAHQLDVHGLELSLQGKGEIAGLVEAIGADGSFALSKDPLRTMSGDAKLGMHAKQVSWHQGDQALDTPALDWDGTLHAEGNKRSLRGALSVGEMHMAIGPHRFELTALSDALDVTVNGEPRTAQLEVSDHIKLRTLHQEIAPPYATGEISLKFDAQASREGVIRVPELRFDNSAAGTTILLHGGLDLGENRRSLSFRGSLTQDLARLWSDKKRFIGRGQLSTDVRVESGDLQRFLVTTSLRVRDGAIELPGQRIKISAIDGEIPLSAEVLFATDGVHLMRNAEVNSYSELRFADQHPLLSRRSYLSIARLETPWATIAPLTGNLAIDNNIVSMSQLELGVRGGRVTGSATVELAGQDTKAAINLRASDVRSSRGEPFDGNTAVTISVRQRSIEGRAEILRIGRRHLLDLLDDVDPPRTDASINNVRRALALGYPDRVRLAFIRGFAAAKVTFGGVARLLRLDEIRGIPMGPIVDRFLDPTFTDQEN